MLDWDKFSSNDHVGNAAFMVWILMKAFKVPLFYSSGKLQGTYQLPMDMWRDGRASGGFSDGIAKILSKWHNFKTHTHVTNTKRRCYES